MKQKVLERKTFRISFAVANFLKYGYVYKDEHTREFDCGEKTTLRDILSARDIIYDLYGGHVTWNRQSKRYELPDRITVLNNLVNS